MNRGSLNKKSVYQEGGTIPKSSANPAINELTQVVKARIDSGEPAEQVLYSFLQEGMPEDQLALAFESVGYDPSSFRQLVQNVEQMAMQMQQSQQMGPYQTSSNDIPDSSKEELLQELEKATSQQELQYGGFPNTTARGPLERLSPGIPRPLYMPPVPQKANIINAAYLLSDSIGELFGKADSNRDGLEDGAFQDFSAKRARYKDKQLQNRTYDVDYGNLDPKNYVANWRDLSEGTIKTKEQFDKDILANSRLDFDPGTNKYFGAFASRADELDVLGKKQQEAIKNSISLSDFVGNVKGFDKADKEVMAGAIGYDPGTGLGINRTSYTEQGRTPEEIKQLRSEYRDLMLGNRAMGSVEPSMNVQPKTVDFNAPMERSIVQVQNTEEPVDRNKAFKDWALQDPVTRMTAAGKEEFDRLNPMMYGGDLPKAQFGPPYDWMQQFQQQQQQLINPDGISDYFRNMGQTNYAEDTAAVANAQLQQRQPGLGPTPEQQAAQDLFNVQTTTNFEMPDVEPQQPTVTRRRNLGNLIDQGETFIKENPYMQAFGKTSEALVMGANLANEFFKQKEFNEYKDKLRNATTADKVYLATQNPSNKRGTFDVNMGLAEPDNLVDYYAQAMYGKELYKKGGEFVPHMMYDPISGKAYEAKVEADHNRFAKMGFVHEDEMQKGGEVEVDNDTLAALIAAGADIEML